MNIVRRDGEDEVLIVSLGVGEVIGEVSLVFRRVSNADVVAAHPTMTLHLPSARFMEIVREHPTLLAQLYELAVKRDEETSSIVAQEASDADGSDHLIGRALVRGYRRRSLRELADGALSRRARELRFARHCAAAQ